MLVTIIGLKGGIGAGLPSAVHCIVGPRGGSNNELMCTDCDDRQRSTGALTRPVVQSLRQYTGKLHGSNILTLRLGRSFDPSRRIDTRRIRRLNIVLARTVANNSCGCIISARVSQRRLRGRVIVYTTGQEAKEGVHLAHEDVSQ